MNVRFLLSWLLLSSLSLSVRGQLPKPIQQPSPPPPTANQQKAPSADEHDVVRITTNLVQLDISVVDKDNKPVADLKPEEFEIKEDNRIQKITNFSYVSAEALVPAASTLAAPAEKNAQPPIPPSSLLPSQVTRTMALVVDDIGLSFESTQPVRIALRKFVDTQMQPGDLVAIIRTAGGMGVLQQFTSDKAQLYAAINNIRWSPSGRTGATSVEPIGGRYDSTPEGQELSEFRNEILAAGSLEPLAYVIRGLKDLPGRKSIVFFSENLRVTSAIGRNDRLLNAMRSVTDAANRASIVIYTQDASGLQPLNYSAVDSPSPGTNDIDTATMGSIGVGRGAAEVGLARLRALAERRNVEFETHTVLDYLAQQTGGTFTRYTNDLGAAIRSAIEDQKSYYLIGYRPDESVFDPVSGRPNFHKWDIKVKRPGLKVHHRNGFYGVADEDRKEVQLTPQARLTKALVSPFASGDVHVRLTTLFRGDASKGAYVNSLIHIDGRDLTFSEVADGWREAAIDVIAVTFGDNGSIVDEIGRTQTIRVRNDTYQRFLQNGLVYNLSVPVKKPGAYQLRVAVRDAATSRLGSAGQFTEVPDLTKDRLALSSIVISSTDPKTNATQTIAPTEQNEDQFEQQIVSAVRRLRYGTLLDYGYVIYNAQLDRVNKQPQLQTQIRLLRDGKEIFAGRVNPFDPAGQTDMKQLTNGGRLQIGAAMLPGQYILQLIVTDQLAKEKFRTATQWIDFEVVK